MKKQTKTHCKSANVVVSENSYEEDEQDLHETDKSLQLNLKPDKN